MSARRRLLWLSLALAPVIFNAACASRRPPAPVSPPAVPEEPPVLPEETTGWSEDGLASWYGGDDGFEGKPTASGEIFDSARLTAAHRDLPLGTVVEVINVGSGASVRVRVNDRGPFVKGRIIDLSREAARRIGIIGPGVAPVRLRVVARGVEPTPFPAGAGPWAVQIGSFAQRDRAERHSARVEAAGFPAYLEPYQSLIRVKVGPIASREDAETKLRSLEEAGFEGLVVPAHP